MEMEHINDDLIKVLIGVDDLEERGIDFLDLIGDQSRIEKFFYSILEEVDVDQAFYDSEAVTFQVIPSAEGLELYISRANLDDLDQIWEDELTQRLRERKNAKKRQKQDQKPEDRAIESEDLEEETQASGKTQMAKDGNKLSQATNRLTNLFQLIGADLELEKTIDYEQEYTEEVVVFQALEDFLMLARMIPSKKIDADLYYLNEHYFLVLYNLEASLKEEKDASKLLSLFEFGDPHRITSSVLQEHGQLIREHDALAFFGSEF